MTNASRRSEQPFDTGLQPERTALAWRRTALALVVGSLVCLRVLPPVLGGWALIPALAGLSGAIAVFVASERRYASHHRILTSADSDRIALPGGGLIVAVAGLTLCGGVLMLSYVLTAALR